MRRHEYLVVGACGTGAGSVWGVGVQEQVQVQVQGGHREQFNPPFLVCVGFLRLRAHWRWFWGGLVQEQVEVQVQGGGRERFQRCGMLPCAGPAARAYVGAGRGT